MGTYISNGWPSDVSLGTPLYLCTGAPPVTGGLSDHSRPEAERQRRGLNRRSLCSTTIFFFTSTLHFSGRLRSQISCSCNAKDALPIEQLRNWLVDDGRLEVRQSVHVKEGKKGRGIFAEEEIQNNELLLRLARAMVVTPGSLDKEILDLLPAGTSEWAVLALFILLEKRRGAESKWAPYMATLPDPWATGSPVFWSLDEVQVLPWSMQKATKARLEMMRNEYDTLASVLCDNALVFHGHVSWDEFRSHYALVCSRAWNLSETTEVLAMVPYCDFLNHSPTSRSLLCHDNETNVVEVTADRDYLAGEEVGLLPASLPNIPEFWPSRLILKCQGEQVMICYGEHSNATLLLDFGFTIPNNPFDQVEVCLALDQQDVLHQQKHKLLVQHGMLPHAAKSSATFNLSLVESPAGRGRGIPHPLRAFSRVMVASSGEELEEMGRDAARQGGRLARRPLQGGGGAREARAMSVLQTIVDDAIEDTRKAQAKASLSPLPVVKKEMLDNLFDGQLGILTSVTAWLRPRRTGGGLVQLLASPHSLRR